MRQLPFLIAVAEQVTKFLLVLHFIVFRVFLFTARAVYFTPRTWGKDADTEFLVVRS